MAGGVGEKGKERNVCVRGCMSEQIVSDTRQVLIHSIQMINIQSFSLVLNMPFVTQKCII